ncbi:protein DEFECTIVE IN MERISTEM SILENCING 3 isoform X2 [Vigna radiata var. radiata]|uniref:Protein DEFECTIVE IN MERISTEM SILENCING 3 isoform X2 n=1 Tax=Vigna radiata var. radiata TaxID=3916 RepID=A0A1S3TCJ5_VIGRR|nr:protein DEFECTIVE IN MERISTEM SILENCING 3 isoform X2 [Vigna radiata var. radiata]
MSQLNHTLNLNDDIRERSKIIKQHEDNLKFIDSQSNQLAESILDLQDSGNGAFHTEEETMEQILKKENSAAGVYSWLKSNAKTSGLTLTKDVVGVVATLGKVESDNLSRMLSEFLGLETMLAIVCSSYEGINALEKYDNEGLINCNAGLYGIGSSIGKRINGRFSVISLADLRPFVGGLVADDPQKKLALPKPRLPNGEWPAGFVDYAVNMIHLDSKHLSFVTEIGYGLRETLFYGIFSRLQIYKTRKEMLLALPCIHEGALSLDGGMIKRSGMFALGSRKDVEVKFPLISGGSGVPPNYIETEEAVRKLNWETAKLGADKHREQQLLDYRKGNIQ